MNAEQLLFEYFDGVVDSPDVVPKLRNFILDLAVRGNLVEQNPDDEPAVELLKRITVERSRLTELIQYRKLKPSDSIESSQIPYLVPLNWCWTQIVHLGLINPKNKAPDSMEASFVPMRLIASTYGVLSQHEKRLWGKIKKGYTHFAEGDVGLTKITPCFENGKSTVFRNLTGGVGSGTTELYILRPLIVLAEYLLIFLKRQQFIETGIQKMTGTAGQKRVPLDYFAFCPFPLPPLAEQHRIVAKVDELMEQCNKLEEKFQERDNHRKRFTKASFASLIESGLDSGEFRKRSEFVVGNFDCLSVDVNQITRLRQLILDLAIRGKLVEQNPNDESAETFLNRVDVKRGKASLVDKNTVVNLDTSDQKYELPYGWKWAVIEDIAYVIMGQSPKSEHCNKAGEGVAFFQGKADFGNRHPTPKNWCVKPNKIAESGDVLISVRAPVGPTNVADQRCCIGRGLAALRPFSGLSREFLLLALQALENDLSSKGYGTTFAAITKKQLTSYSIPLPPLAEQHRIVAKVDKLMEQCDWLEEKFRLKETLQSRSFYSVLARSLNDQLIG